MNIDKGSILLIIFLVMAASLAGWNYFSPTYQIERIYIERPAQMINLLHKNIFINSEKVFTDSLIFAQDKDYQIDYENGTILFLSAVGDVFVEYQFYPDKLSKRYQLFEEIQYQDTLKIETIKKKQQLFRSSGQLNITGNKTISISVANNDDFSLDQSLFLKINGRLSSNLNIEGQLSDSQSPITPEGDSREISSLDQIFLRIYNRKYELALGDLEMEFERTEFFNYTPKFEGMKAARWGRNSIKGAVAIAKGKRGVYSFPGVEGKQGPYYINVGDVSGVQIVPGSEDVYLDGSKLLRGSDYTIDYSEGSITFTNSNFISDESDVRVNFQYTDEQYRQNLYLASSYWQVTDKLKLTPQIIWQVDDKENPLLEDLSEDDITLMEAVGDSVVFGNGIFYVEDGSGNYNYDESGEFYFYVGDDSSSTGFYNLRFTYVGAGNGFYNKSVTGDYYIYVGESGEYLPVRKLTAPESQGNVGLNLKYSADIYQVEAEGILTNNDKNLWSEKDDDDNSALAGNLKMTLSPDWDKFMPRISIQQRNWQEKLVLFSDLDTPSAFYEMENTPDTLATSETSIKSNFTLYDKIHPAFAVKLRKVKDYLEQNYQSFSTRINDLSAISYLEYRFINQRQDYKNIIDLVQFDLINHQAEMRLELGKVYVFSRYQFIENKYKYKLIDDIGSRRNQIEETFGYQLGDRERIELYWQSDVVDSLGNSNSWNKKKQTNTYGIKSKLEGEEYNLSLNVAHRIIEKNGEDNNFDLAELSFNKKMISRMININGTYELQNVEFYPKLRELEFVGEELGIYDSLGFVSDEGEYDYVVTSIDYDNPQMSVQVNGNLSFDVDPGKITENYWKNVRWNSYLMINENSISDNKKEVYLLHPDYIRDSKNTLFGRYVIDQDLHINLMPGKVNSRFSWRSEETLDQRYNDSLDSTERQEYSCLFRFFKVIGFNWELEGRVQEESESRYKLNSQASSGELTAKKDLTSKFSYRTSVIYSKEEGDEQSVSNEYKLRSYQISQFVTYFGNIGFKVTGRFQYKINEREGFNFTSYREKQDGVISKWALILNYKMNNFTYFTLEYSGDDYPDRDQNHKFRMEIKAEL